MMKWFVKTPEKKRKETFKLKKGRSWWWVEGGQKVVFLTGGKKKGKQVSNIKQNYGKKVGGEKEGGEKTRCPMKKKPRGGGKKGSG